MLSWSPASNGFFVNDGQGSGMTSVLRVFRLQGRQLVGDPTIQKTASTLFRREKRCSPRAADPNVWGLGWSPDGQYVYLLVQATVHRPCGAPESFIGVTIRVDDDSVKERLSERATQRRFGSLLPPELRSR
jgi:hypothetical protein